MEALTKWLTWPSIAAAAASYLATLAAYRLFLHPLARFPGPKLAAVTRWYEGYYDVWLSGQYTFKIAELHKQYGPIVRISPHELHVNDSSFYDTLYARHDGVWHKYPWAMSAFSTPGASLWTSDHTHHKNRRAPLAPFFSKSKVSSQQAMVLNHVERLCSRFAGFAAKKESVDMGAAVTAFVRDVTNEYIFGRHYGDLEIEDFDPGMMVAAQAGGMMWRVTKFVRFFGPLVKSIPAAWMLKNGDPAMACWFRFMIVSKHDTEALIAAASDVDDQGPRTLIHEIVQSKLPEPEKALERVYDEVATTTGAGYETTAAVLRIALFHIYHRPLIRDALRSELYSSSSTSDADTPELRALEKLPYLTAVIMESMRLAPAMATRSARIAQDKGLVYGEYQIPAGTPVGMTVHLMHQNEDEYPEPERFLPERWMEPDPWHIGGRTFVPFGKGKRGCLGMHLAWAELYLLLATLVRRFEFRFPSTGEEDFQVTSDNFAIVTACLGVIPAFVSEVQNERPERPGGI